jgi:uncharacterized membrane protein
LSLASAVLYGAADFIGGLATRRLNTISVVVLSQISGLIALLLVLPVLAPSAPRARDLQWGMLAGIAGTVGVSLLYRALAVGTMGVVAPLTAVCAVAIPVLVSVVMGMQPSALTAAGIGLALVAIVLIAQERRAAAGDPAGQSGTMSPEEPSGAAGTVAGRAADRGVSARTRDAWPAGVPQALASGVAIGIFFVILARTGRDSGLWPLVASRATSLVVFAAAAWLLRRPLRVSARDAALCALCGLLDVAANVFYLLASREGSLPTVVTLSSMYPASTVLLARVLLGERLNAVQIAGLGCALLAVAMIVRG